MASIILRFSAADDFGSMAIRLFEHGAYSHVDAVLDDGSLLGARDDVWGEIPKGVQIRPGNYGNFSAIKFVHIPCTDEQKQKFLDFLHSQIGKPYDETAILAFLVGRDWRSQDSWFCSELAAAVLEAANVFPYKLSATENKVTPGDLFLICSVLTNVN